MILKPERTGEGRSCQPLWAGVSWSFLTGIQEERLTGQQIAPCLFVGHFKVYLPVKKTAQDFFVKLTSRLDSDRQMPT